MIRKVTMVIVVSCLVIFSGCLDPEKKHWKSCVNPVAKDFAFRLGKWKQVETRTPSCETIEFTSPDRMTFYPMQSPYTGPEEINRNVPYKFTSCDQFQFDKYWIKNRLPNDSYWEGMKCYYDHINDELLLIETPDFITGYFDTLRFTKVK